MLAKLGELLKPAHPARDSDRKQDANDGRKKRQQATNGAVETLFDDVVSLSISSIRALVREEAELSARAPELLRQLAILEQHGLQSLPVMPGQPVAEAIVSAASFLSSSR